MDSEDFDGLVEGLREAVDDIKARQAAYVKEVRAKTQLSQQEFARRYHLNVRTLQRWEVGQSVDQSSRALLKMIDRDPVVVDQLLNS